ncbi:hypothetical protein MPNT_160062 [Candidatus Methylacidithermus pantelleriae]|uniref:Uncharacterized protein n=1 Tax=Candidatus Methylacidithermus pantelleriae TaxID=2744239 RepID=A0A8J2FS84_9BACT|nr:hypothetical protein MPNT_160062 [Candidatus Methylacidithermus pantelleriae]
MGVLSQVPNAPLVVVWVDMDEIDVWSVEWLREGGCKLKRYLREDHLCVDWELAAKGQGNEWRGCR